MINDMRIFFMKLLLSIFDYKTGTYQLCRLLVVDYAFFQHFLYKCNHVGVNLLLCVSVYKCVTVIYLQHYTYDPSYLS